VVQQLTPVKNESEKYYTTNTPRFSRNQIPAVFKS